MLGKRQRNKSSSSSSSSSFLEYYEKSSRNMWSVSMFQKYRSYMTRFCELEICPLLESHDVNNLIVHAPVKCGKREIVEYMAMRDEHSNRVHAFVSSWHRKADESQRQELKRHNLEVFSGKVNKCIPWIDSLDSEKIIVIHLDECDYGTGTRQILNTFYQQVQKLRTERSRKITLIFYSATPEEALYSMSMDSQLIKYTPPDGYCGAKKFLEENLVFNAMPFFLQEQSSSSSSSLSFSLSCQGREIMAKFLESFEKNPRRNVLVLRLASESLFSTSENRSIYTFLKHWKSIPGLESCIVKADISDVMKGDFENVRVEQIEWSSRLYWTEDHLPTHKPIIMVIDQTSTRSTEWKGHDRIFAYHDYRNSISYSTIVQAQERVNHYLQNYGNEFQPIQVYGHVKTFELSAGLITYEEYLAGKYRLKFSKERHVFQIVNSLNKSEVLEDNFKTRKEAEIRVQQLSRFQMSPRVSNSVSVKNKTDCEFFPCNFLEDKEWNEFVEKIARLKWPEWRIERPKNVKTCAETLRLMGNLRGSRVLDYDEDIVKDKEFGLNAQSRHRRYICYKGDVLGIAVCVWTDEIVTRVSCETARTSMYF